MTLQKVHFINFLTVNPKTALTVKKSGFVRFILGFSVVNGAFRVKKITHSGGRIL